MTQKKLRSLLALGCALAFTAGVCLHAEEVDKKLRVSLAVGQFGNNDVVPSDSANVLTIVDQNQQFVSFIEDPRNDNGALGQLEIRAANRVLASVQYAFQRFFLIEGTIGYQRGKVGDVEMQAEFDGLVIDPTQRYNYTIFEVPVGTMTQVPIQISAIARFRPKARFNPYLGIGIGYAFVGFKPSGELNNLSQAMDHLTGGQAIDAQYPAVLPTLPTEDQFQNLKGASIDARDVIEWHAVGGFELTFKKHWAVYADYRYETANRSFFIGFNGSDSLGKSVPSRQAVEGSPETQAIYGPIWIKSGGLVDGGRPINPDTYVVGGATFVATPGICGTKIDPTAPDVPANQCVFLLNSAMAKYNQSNAGVQGFVPVSPDGVPDPGLYFVKGGSIKYGGSSLTVGVRYTF